jgi:hypothetical protein
MTMFKRKSTGISSFVCLFMLLLSGISRANENMLANVTLLCEGTISSNVEWNPVIRIMYARPPQNPAETLAYQDGKFVRYISLVKKNRPITIIWIDNIPHYTYSAEFIFNGVKSELRETVRFDNLTASYIKQTSSQEGKKSYTTTFSLNRYSGRFHIIKKSLNGLENSLVSSGSGLCKRTSRIF